MMTPLYKLSFFLFFLFYGNIYAQSGTGNDTKYLNTDVSDIKNFKDVVLKDFSFRNSTLDYGYRFQPTTHYKVWTETSSFGVLRGEIKKITKFRIEKISGRALMISYTEFSKNGQIINIFERTSGGGNTTGFEYDERDRLLKRLRVAENNTMRVDRFSYNDNNQLVDASVEYDELQRPHKVWYQNKSEPGVKLRYLFTYDRNKVKMTEFSSRTGDSLITKEYTYSENLNLISEINPFFQYFHSYDLQNRLVKTVTFKDRNYSNTQTFEYDEWGNVVLTIKKWKNNFVETGKTIYRYDQVGNVVYRHFVHDGVRLDEEFLYEIEYY